MPRTVADAGRMMLARPSRDEPPLDVFLRVTGVVLVVCTLVGAVFGFVRGLGYLPTIWFAVPEGAVLIGLAGALPAIAIGAVVAGGHWLRWRP